MDTMTEETLETTSQQTVIDSGTTISGKITGDGDVLVQGKLNGEAHLSSTITVAAEGTSTAKLTASNIVIDGQQEGDVTAEEMIRITPSGKVKSNLKAPTISIEKGALFSGAIEMTESN